MTPELESTSRHVILGLVYVCILVFRMNKWTKKDQKKKDPIVYKSKYISDLFFIQNMSNKYQQTPSVLEICRDLISELKDPEWSCDPPVENLWISVTWRIRTCSAVVLPVVSCCLLWGQTFGVCLEVKWRTEIQLIDWSLTTIQILTHRRHISRTDRQTDRTQQETSLH